MNDLMLTFRGRRDPDDVIDFGIRALRLESGRRDLDRVLERVVDRARMDRVATLPAKRPTATSKSSNDLS